MQVLVTNIASYLYVRDSVTSRAIVRDAVLILNPVGFTLLKKVKESIGNVDRIL